VFANRVCFLQDLHLENAELRQKLWKLTSGAVSSVTPSSATPSSVTPSIVTPSTSAASSKTSVARPPNPLEEYAGDFDQLGRGFCVISEVWVPPTALNQPYPERLRDIGPYHDTRYDDERSKREGVVAELYGFIPAKYHKHLEGSPFFTDKVHTPPPSQTTPILTLFSSLVESVR